MASVFGRWSIAP